jgi:hypothetical protein
MPLTNEAVQYIRLGEGGSYSLARDAISHRIWDVRTFGTTISDYTYFSQPVGAAYAGFQKTLNETNLYDTGKLPNGQTFLAQRMGLAALVIGTGANAVTAMADFANILSSSVFDFKLAGREYDFQIHGRQFLPTPLAAFGIAASTNARVGDMISAGWVKIGAAPIFLDQLVSFSVVQRVQNAIPTLVTALNTSCTNLNGYYMQLMVIIDGFLTRAK